MNDKYKEAFEKWWYDFCFGDYSQADVRTLPVDYSIKAWQAAIEYKQKEIDELKSQIYVTGSIHEQGDIKREMTWKESSEMMENFNEGLMKQLDDLKIKFRNVQAENSKLRDCVEFYSDRQNPNSIFNPDYQEEVDCDFFEETQLIHFGKRARQVLKELGDK